MTLMKVNNRNEDRVELFNSPYYGADLHNHSEMFFKKENNRNEEEKSWHVPLYIRQKWQPKSETFPL